MTLIMHVVHVGYSCGDYQALERGIYIANAWHLKDVFPHAIQRLGRLVRDGRMVEALQLGLDLFSGKAQAVVGMLRLYDSITVL